MTKIIAIANQKGGVGKTTSCINLAACLANRNKKILLIDLDPQGNATMGSGVNKNNLTTSMLEVLLSEATVEEVLSHTAGGYDLLPANSSLTQAEVSLLNMENKEQQLKLSLQAVHGRYDFILIDCPPSLNMLTVNALVAANSVLIPLQCEYYALEGLAALLKTIEGVRKTANPSLSVEGLLRTMYDPRNKLTMEVSAELATHFGDLLYQTEIPRNIRLAESPSYGQSIVQYDRNSRGALAYLALADELLDKQNNSISLLTSKSMEDEFNY